VLNAKKIVPVEFPVRDQVVVLFRVLARRIVSGSLARVLTVTFFSWERGSSFDITGK